MYRMVTIRTHGRKRRNCKIQSRQQQGASLSSRRQSEMPTMNMGRVLRLAQP